MPTLGSFVVDFVIHDDGPATNWAATAKVGSVLGVAGPRGSSVISTDGIGLHLLIGDETALPAIARSLGGTLPANTSAWSLLKSSRVSNCRCRAARTCRSYGRREPIRTQ